MKIQDIGFLLFLAFLFYLRNPRWFVIAGLILLILAIPLFAFWVFFTAQRFVAYAAALLFIAVVYYLYKLRKS